VLNLVQEPQVVLEPQGLQVPLQVVESLLPQDLTQDLPVVGESLVLLYNY
jgi:hypothetical protein